MSTIALSSLLANLIVTVEFKPNLIITDRELSKIHVEIHKRSLLGLMQRADHVEILD